jgi:hypothetical protein
MPNLYNTDLAQNARRTATGGSNYGTRRVQFFQITVYSLSDAEVAKLDNYRAVNNTEIDIDQEPEREFKTATIAELVVRAVQSVAEVYIVGAHDVDSNGEDDNDFYLIVGVAGDTFSSGNEMDNRDDPATTDNNNPYMTDALDDVLDFIGGPGDWDVYPVFIYGDNFASVGGTSALSRVERKAASAAARLARKQG